MQKLSFYWRYNALLNEIYMLLKYRYSIRNDNIISFGTVFLFVIFSIYIFFIEIKFIWFQPHHDWKHTTLVNCSILLFWPFIHLLKTVSICNDSFVLLRYLRWSLYIYDQFVCWQILITHATYYLFLNLDKCRHIIHIQNTIKHNTVVVLNPWVYLRFY